ncbi:hypothetical protein [Streptomyces sp. NRRL F-5126]|uniref:DUF7736 domain-containing protein n=1 Tax=Streptomyces sp. NRRL F-5126 TaxID=1463857 RepID=UPI0004C96DFC|nr:hypothetical protein [Streptomyces sp. NRRL F-5126]
MSETRSVPLADILGVTAPGRLPRRRKDGRTALLHWMTGARLEPWQRQRAVDECAPELLRQHPVLCDLAPPPAASDARLAAWLGAAEREIGSTLPVAPLAHWAGQDPALALSGHAAAGPTG